MLIRRYFGSKLKLFEAAFIESLPDAWPGDLQDGSRSDFGARLAGSMLSDQYSLAISLSRISADDPEAKRVGIAVIEDVVMPPMAQWLGGSKPLSRARQIVILTSAFHMHLDRLPRKGDVDDETVRWFAQSIQAIVDANAGRQGSGA